jgi:alkanesulfonate monooxygenase SsuD/methylene tetrahydromethanopterin reductase-like flavin-dependent oxidoreductase (luciferase family)
VARRADGWAPAGLPAPLLATLWAALREAAARHGRDPTSLRVIYRANPLVTPQALGAGRRPFTGALDEVAEDLAAVARLGVDELLVDLQATTESVPELLETARQLAAALRRLA